MVYYQRRYFAETVRKQTLSYGEIMDNKETVVQESVYSEEGEITFKGLLGFLKRSWLRFVIYLAVALLVVTAVYGGVKFFGDIGHFTERRSD